MMDNLKLQELVRTEAGDLFDVCDGLPISCKLAVTLAMVHVAKAVEELIAMDGIDRIADRPLRDAEGELIQIHQWLLDHGTKAIPAPGATTIASLTIDALNALWNAKCDLLAQLDAAHATPKALNVTIVPGLPGTWNPNTEVR